MNLDQWLGVLIAASLVVATAPTGAASTTNQAPGDLDVTYENKTLELEWEASSIGGQATYSVASNGTLVESSIQTNAQIWDTPVHPSLRATLDHADGDGDPTKWAEVRVNAANPCIQFYLEGVPPVFLDPDCLEAAANATQPTS